MIPEEIEVGKVYRVFGSSLYMGVITGFDGKYAEMRMLTGRIIQVPWYEINSPANISKEELEKNADKIYREEEDYLEGYGTHAIY